MQKTVFLRYTCVYSKHLIECYSGKNNVAQSVLEKVSVVIDVNAFVHRVRRNLMGTEPSISLHEYLLRAFISSSLQLSKLFTVLCFIITVNRNLLIVDLVTVVHGKASDDIADDIHMDEPKQRSNDCWVRGDVDGRYTPVPVIAIEHNESQLKVNTWQRFATSGPLPLFGRDALTVRIKGKHDKLQCKVCAQTQLSSYIVIALLRDYL